MKTVTFLADGTFESSAPFCVLEEDAPNDFGGTYTTEDSHIIPMNCQWETALSYELEDDQLVIYLPCIEPCAEKYVRAVGTGSN